MSAIEKVGPRKVIYTLADVEAFIAANTTEQTERQGRTW